MAASMDSGKWIFTKEQLLNTPSRKCNIDQDKETYYRQQAATLIQEMGQRLQVTQLCINTAIVYVHRFYMFHSFSKFHRNPIASCSLFLAAKVEEQPRKLEHVIRVAHMCLNKDQRHLDINSEQYIEQAQELINNENILLQTLGFDVAIDHPHTQVLKCCQHLFRASSKDMAQTSYFMATNSLHLTTMCLQYKPTVVACVCIHLVCKWFNFEIPQSSEGKDWYWYVDKTVTLDLLDELTVEFLAIFNKCPSRLRKKVMQQHGVNASIADKNAGNKESSSSHPEHRVRTDSSSATAKPGERVPRPHEPRRDKTGAIIPPSSSTASAPPGHRPSSNSGHPPSHSNRPPDHHHHQQPQPGHPGSSSRPPHPHQRPSVKDPKQASSQSSSSTTHQHHHHHQHHQQHQHQQPKQPQQPHSSSSQQRKPSVLPPNAAPKAPPPTSTGSLFSPPRVEQQQEQRKPNNNDLNRNKPTMPFVQQQEWSGNGNSVPAQPAAQQVNLSTSLGFSLDLDDICEDQDSTWDINYGLNEANSILSSPNAVIESMLNMNAPAAGEVATTSANFQKQQAQQQSLFSMLAQSPKIQQTTPQLPVTPQAQLPPNYQPQQSLFDVGLDMDPFPSIKTEEALIDIKSTPVAEVVVADSEEVESTSGKKKKKKKEKHKNKDKDREGKEKEKKHKHKHKEKEKNRDKDKVDGSTRLKISLSDASPVEDPAAKPVLKIKIPKGRIEGDIPAVPSNGSAASPAVPAQPVLPAGGLKIKISRELIKEKESGRKRSSTTSSSSLNHAAVPSSAAKVAKMEPFQARAHHERNGSSVVAAAAAVPVEEQRQRSHTAHRSSGVNKVPTFPATSATNAYSRQQQPVAAAATGQYPPFIPPAYPPPMGHPPYYNPFPPAPYPYHMYPVPYQQGPPMPPMMNNHSIHPPPPMPPSMATGMPPLPREPPPQVPPPPPPQPHQ